MRTSRAGLLVRRIVAATVLFLPSTAIAQAVRGIVRDSASNRPIADVALELLTESGARSAATLAREGGEYFLRAPADGLYRVRLLRIGYRRTVSEPFTLAAGGVLEKQLRMSRLPARLIAVSTVEAPRCRLQADDGSIVASLWEEARKALTVVELTDHGAQLRMRLRDYVHEVPIRTAFSARASESFRDGISTMPYTSASPDSIDREGYVQARGTNVYYLAPGAQVLGSDIFMRTHCFWLQRDDRRADTSLVGVHFEPAGGRNRPDIRGVAWLDRHSAELRSVEYAYTGLPDVVRDARAGGSVEVVRIPGAGWIIQRWEVRAPIVKQVARQTVGGSIPGAGGFTRAVVDTLLTGVSIQGGEVLSARRPSGETLWSTTSGIQSLTESTPPAADPLRDSVSEHESMRVRETMLCDSLRTERERSIASAFAVPLSGWQPSGRDSLATVQALRGALTVLEAVADTNGRVDLATVRAVRRGPPAAYAAALDALIARTWPVDQPRPGCRVRRVVLLPYRLAAGGR